MVPDASTTHTPRRLILLAGLGADQRLFAPLLHLLPLLPGDTIHTPPYPDPEPTEDLPTYARRLAAPLDLQLTDIIGGASFGGMLAAQIATDRIAARQPPAVLLLLGTCLSPQSLPRLYARLVPALRFVPAGLFRAKRLLGPFMRRQFAPIDSTGLHLLIAMLQATSPALLRRGGRMIMRWQGLAKPTCPTLMLHGARDRIIPATRVPADQLLSHAGHAFTLTHPAETTAALQVFLAGLPTSTVSR